MRRGGRVISRVGVLLSVLLALLSAIPPFPAAAQGIGTPAPPIVQSGWLTINWGDGPPGSGLKKTDFALTAEDGSTIPIQMGASTLRANGGIWGINRRQVSLQGRWAIGGQSFVFSVDRVDSVGEASPQGLSSLSGSDTSAITGPQPWINILCKYHGDSTEPKPLTYFDGLFSSSYPGLDHYWREVSYDNVNIAGTSRVGWFELPRTLAQYLSDSRGLLNALFEDCTALADPTVYFPDYVGINMMFNDELDGYAWGGSHWASLDGESRIWYTTWEPPWGYGNQTAIAHEMGHGFGLPHSTDDWGAAHGNPYTNDWDVMSDSWANCGDSTSPTYGCLGQHTISYHKDQLDWIPPARKYTATAGSHTITLEELAQPGASDYWMAQIPIGGSSTHFYTVEARQKGATSYDVKLWKSAVIIHEVDSGRSEPAHVVDETSDGDTSDAGYLVDGSFTDAANEITVSVDSATSNGFVVTITLGGATATPTGTSTSTATLSSTPSATPTSTASFTPTATSTHTLTPSATATQTPTASATPTPTSTYTPTPTVTHSATSTVTSTPTYTATSTATSTATVTRTSTSTYTPTPSVTHSATSTASNTQTTTETSAPSGTTTPTPTQSETHTATSTVTSTPTYTSTTTSTRSPTATVTGTASHTVAPTMTQTPTSTSTYTPTHTEVGSATPTPTQTPTFTPTPSPSPSATATAISSATATVTASITPSPSATPTASHTATATASLTPAPTGTPSSTATMTGTWTPSASPTSTGTVTTTPTPTATHTLTLTTVPGDTSTPTATSSPTNTQIPSGTPTPTATLGPSSTATRTPTGTQTSLATVTVTATATGTGAAASTATWTATGTSEPAATNTPRPTKTSTPKPGKTLTSSGNASIAIEELPPYDVDFLGREYFVARSRQHGNVDISPVEIGDPQYAAGEFTLLDGWRFYDGGELVDSGGVALLAQEGNSWRLELIGDDLVRTARLYVAAHHNTAGTTRFSLSAGAGSRTITKDTLGLTAYRITVIFTGQVAVEMRVLESSASSAIFWLGGAADFSILPTPTPTEIGAVTPPASQTASATSMQSPEPTIAAVTREAASTQVPGSDTADAPFPPTLNWLVGQPLLVLALIGILLLGLLALLLVFRAM